MFDENNIATVHAYAYVATSLNIESWNTRDSNQTKAYFSITSITSVIITISRVRSLLASVLSLHVSLVA